MKSVITTSSVIITDMMLMECSVYTRLGSHAIAHRMSTADDHHR